LQLAHVNGAVADVAADFALTQMDVQAAVDEYAEFGPDVDAEAARARDFARRGRARQEISG